MSIGKQLEEAVVLQEEIVGEIQRLRAREIVAGEDWSKELDQLAVSYIKIHLLIKYLDKEMLEMPVSIDSEWLPS